VKVSDVQNWTDQGLLERAYAIGREIDRRWEARGAGRKPVRFKDCVDVFTHFHYRLWPMAQEHLYSLALDHRYGLIEERLISLGTVNASLIHAREVFAPALEKRACSVILVHNHPTGLARPSSEDLGVTKRLKKVGELIGIALLDHMIIGKYQYYSSRLDQLFYC